MLFDRKIEPSCSYCSFGTALDRDEVMCIKRGIMAGSGSCASFHYEPTKRVPEVGPSFVVTGYTEEDFTL